ncbi:MAG: hypothetical protein NT069_11535 [Planctomycetota bacterium]|nr:hypothetical protein [Planctomycetota bacterium]
MLSANLEADVVEFDAPDNVVELDWFSDTESVRVIQRDQTRFEIQKDRVIKILQLANDSDKQLELLLSKLGEWVRHYQRSIKNAYLTLRDGGFAFVVISRSTACDDDLEDAVSELDVRVANDADLKSMSVNALILPPTSKESLSSFLDSRFLLHYRDNRILQGGSGS